MKEDRSRTKTSSKAPDCPMCEKRGRKDGPSILVKTWNEELKWFDHGYFHRWICTVCGFKWLT